MFKMPEEIKEKLRELDILCKQTQQLEDQLDVILFGYGIDPNIIKGLGTGAVKTEAFADIINGFGDIEENIKDIERVFLHYAKED